MQATIERVLKKYPEVYRHSCAVRDLATNFAQHLGFSHQAIAKIRYGAYIHDVGKSFLDERILFKEGRLTEEEFELVKQHTELGFCYMVNMNTVWDPDILAMVVQHHERVDGTGYPFALKGNEIHPFAKLISLCDVYDALTSKRSYKEAFDERHASSIIQKGLGTQFDRVLGESFLDFIEQSHCLVYQTS